VTMMTISQCRAARGLLGWTQQDLADASGLSKTAINNFEKGHSDIKAESLRAIRMAFESADIEFIKDEGLRKKQEKTEILSGESAFSILLEDIFETMKDKSGEIQIINRNETTTGQTSEVKLLEHHERMKLHGIKERIICSKGHGNTNAAQNGERRHLPEEAIGTAMTTFLYGNKVAFELWDQSTIVIIENAGAHQAELARFEKLWDESLGKAANNADKKTAQHNTSRKRLS